MNEWPKLMCACGHMADAKNNTTVCDNCWQTAKLILTGDGAHDLRTEIVALRQTVERMREAFKKIVCEEIAVMRADGIPENKIGTANGFTSRILSMAKAALSSPAEPSKGAA